MLEALSSDLYLCFMGDGFETAAGPRRGLTSSSELLFFREADRLSGLKREGGCTSLSI